MSSHDSQIEKEKVQIKKEKVLFKKWGDYKEKEYDLKITFQLGNHIGLNRNSNDRVKIDIFDKEVFCGKIRIYPYRYKGTITAEIGNLETVKEYEGMGIGTFLMARGAEEAKLMGYTKPWFVQIDEKSDNFYGGLMKRFLDRGIQGIIWNLEEKRFVIDLDKIDFNKVYSMFGYKVFK